MSKLYDIAIIGGGASGTSAAFEASKLGLKNILLIEKGDQPNQTVRSYYKEGKRVDKDYKGEVITLLGTIDFKDSVKEDFLAYFDSLLQNDDFDIVYKTEVEGVKKEGDTFKVTTASAEYEAKNVLVCIGKMGKPNKPSYKIPPAITKKVNFNLDNCTGNEKILVVGGGNSAAEYAIELSKNNEVTLNYRRDTFSRLNDINEKDLMDCANKKELELKLGCDITELDNADGNVKVNFTTGDNIVYDRVIYAIGGTTPIDFLKKCEIELDESGTPLSDENMQTKIEGLYVGGDIAVDKGGSIALALNHGFKVVKHITSK